MYDYDGIAVLDLPYLSHRRHSDSVSFHATSLPMSISPSLSHSLCIHLPFSLIMPRSATTSLPLPCSFFTNIYCSGNNFWARAGLGEE